MSNPKTRAKDYIKTHIGVGWSLQSLIDLNGCGCSKDYKVCIGSMEGVPKGKIYAEDRKSQSKGMFDIKELYDEVKNQKRVERLRRVKKRLS